MARFADRSSEPAEFAPVDGIHGHPNRWILATDDCGGGIVVRAATRPVLCEAVGTRGR
jgi:hypothetical protein